MHNFDFYEHKLLRYLCYKGIEWESYVAAQNFYEDPDKRANIFKCIRIFELI